MKVSSLLKLIAAGAISLLVLIFGLSAIGHNVAGEVQILQSPGGSLTVRSNPGYYWTGFSKVEDYRQIVTVGFGTSQTGNGSASVPPVVVTFNDLANANMSGLVRIRLPVSDEKLIQIRKNYAGGFDHFITNGIVPVVQNAFRIAANLRGAQESATTLALFQQRI